ncbi:aldose 1-epimerase [Tellurirhabdus rosea]|uniref:aldose 1-epimerase n=1 Tax=Tellurirhabdus rosea TaxID=2674997 RepID=UPI00225BF0DB|nr:aldose 1-epimerase [Tellurirhabdus rosea]
MPFHLSHSTFGSYTELILENAATGEFFSVIPAHGAMVRQLVLNKADRAVSLLHTPASPEALLADETYASALLFPFPSRIPQGRYTFDDMTHHLPLNEEKQLNAIHGFVAGQPFEVFGQEITEEQAALTFRYVHDGSYVGYPFPFDFRVTYALAADGVFSVQYEVQNTGHLACPAAFGWHPYFTLNAEPVDELTVTLPIAKQILLNSNLLPVGEEPVPHPVTLPLRDRELDAAFVVIDDPDAGATTVVQAPGKGLSLCIWQETGPEKFPYLVVFTHPARDRVAIEPLTSNVNAFNNRQGLLVLEPNGTASGEIRVWLS